MIDDPELPCAGVHPIDKDSARWCVWAPRASRVELLLGSGAAATRLSLERLSRGFYACTTPRPSRGQRYAYVLDDGPPLPDPVSRWQPDGVETPSAVWWPEDIHWDEGPWRGIARQDLVIYELHVGTFTAEGTFDAIVPRLGVLRDLGITAIELMPVAQFAGTHGWGYDGVFPFAVQNTYGGPDGLRRLIGACHRQGLALFVDVVYNHFGPEGNVLPRYGPYLTEEYKTVWGSAVNYDDRGSDPVRAMVLENSRMWVRDFRVDGLRLDATDQIIDRSPRHVLSELAEVVHTEAERLGRPCHVFAETDQNDSKRYLGARECGGLGLDGHWNDDFHHAAHVVLTGETSGYYQDFAAGAPCFAKALERTFINDGVYSPFRDRRHGTSAVEFPGDRFVAFTENHDQVGNRALSERYACWLAPAKLRLAAGLLLLAPRLPLLFMGQEYGEDRPFPFFCDFAGPELRDAVRRGRMQEFAHFSWKDEPPDPLSPATRESAVLSWRWSEPTRAGLRLLYRDLLRLRRELPTLRDFRHARTRLLHQGNVLEVLRGGTEPQPTPLLRMYFNLSDHAETLPVELAAELPHLRSEIVDYGAGGPDADFRFTHLRPFEFQLYGPPRATAERLALQ
jgi:maltooligosyltrehalose trehalohydrolase